MNKLFPFFVLLCLFIVSCTGGKTGSSEENNTPLFVHEDTVEVTNLVSNYLDSLKAKKFDKAPFFLYRVDDGKVYNLLDDEREDIKNQWKNIPVLDYKIDSISLYKEDSCRVYYSVKIFDLPEGSEMPDRMNFILAPQRVNGIWYLTLFHQYPPIE